jgi:phosphotransferase system enzyme I (PtsP)
MKVQARALIDAAAGKVLNVMFPMVSEPWEFDEARGLFEAQRVWLEDHHHMLPSEIRYGCMLEVPALAEVLDQLLPRVDFLSIGTNDLTQFLLAADRSDPRIADRYDWLSPAILRFLKRIIDATSIAGIPTTICGEMGGRPLEALALIGLGIESLSITPAAVGAIKAMVRTADSARLQPQMDKWLAEPPDDLRQEIQNWAEQHDVTVA